jgi:hypothetical protein
MPAFCVNWTAVAAIATSVAAFATWAAVAVALYPICQARRRNKDRAHHLRILLGANLVTLRPSLLSYLQPPQHPHAVLSSHAFQRTTQEINVLVAEALVLDWEEQVSLQDITSNLTAFALLHRTPDASKESAKHIAHSR